MATNPYEALIEKNPYEGMANGTEQQAGPQPGIMGFMAENRARNAELFKNGWGSGIPQAIYDVGGKVTDLTGSPAAGGITNFMLNAIPTLFMSGRLADVPPASMAEAPAKWLMQTAVKPSKAARSSGDAQRAMSTMLEKEIYPTTSGMAKADRLAGALDRQVETAIGQSDAAVGTQDIANRVGDVYSKFRMQMNPQSDISAIRQVMDDYWASPNIAGKTEIPVQLAHALKRGTYSALGGKAYGEVGTAATEAQKALARGAREEVARLVPQVAEPLRQESALMNVKDVAMDRAMLEANKNPLGLAALRMDSPVSSLSFLADRWAALKAFLALQMFHGAKPQAFGPLGFTASQDGPALMQSAGILSRQESGK